MKINRNHWRVWICLFAALALTPKVFAQAEIKVPHVLPVAEDVKTPAPAPTVGESRIPRSSPRPTSTPAPIGTKHAPNAMAADAHARAMQQRFDHVQVGEPGDGAIWARGRDYKASFASDGVTFVPFFGSKAERNWPVRFTLDSAHIGAEEIAIEASAAPRHMGDHVDFARGAIVERWNLATGSIEQQFVIDALAPTGDLDLVIGVTTELCAESTHGALAFGCELGRVEYGAAVAIDADGRHFPLATTWNGTAIDLHLDRAALASARFPIVVDPVISTTTFDSSLSDDYTPDVAYEAATDSYLVVYEETYSATDHDVYGLHIDATGAPLYGGYLDYTTDDWVHPKVASNALAQNFLCVASVRPAAGGVREIRGVTFAAPTNTSGAQFSISGNEIGDKLNPDVGGDPVLSAPTYYFVVWQRNYSASDQDIHGRLVNSNGTNQSGTIFVDNSSNTIDTVPAISKSDGHAPFTTQNWTIVWQRFYFGTQEQVWGAQYLWDGSLTHATFPIDQGDHCLAPSVSSLSDGDGFTRPYMVSFQVQGQQQTDWDIIGAIFEGTQFVVGTDIGNQVSLATLSSNQIHPRVDCDGKHFSVTWAQEFLGGFYDWDIFVADLVYAGGYPHVTAWDTFAYTGLQELNPSITSTYSGGGAGVRYLAAWDQLDQYTPGSVHEIWTGLWDGGQGGFAKTFCFGDGSIGVCPCSNFGSAGNGCANSVNPNGANLSFAGNPWIGNDSFVLLGSGMPNSAALYFQGTAPANYSAGVTFGDGLRCVGGNTVRLGTKLNIGGASQVPDSGDPTISSHTILPSTGTLLYYQAWYRNAAAFCSASTFNLTNGLYAVWAP